MKGILFKPEMLQACIEGRKSVTRRLIKPQPVGGLRKSVFSSSGIEDAHGKTVKPRYLPGEIVYVKEGWCEDYYGQNIHYKLDGGESPGPKGFWRSPLMMPEKCARYWLRIKDVRAERLQEITEDEARREGVVPGLYKGDGEFWFWQGGRTETSHEQMIGWGANYRDGFRFVWKNINGPGSWEASPWVFRHEFEFLKVRP